MKDGKLLDLMGFNLRFEADRGYSIEEVLKFIALSELITSESILAKSLSHEKKIMENNTDNNFRYFIY
tara:strand:+ start:545 stop:748 length:204 start_codon:yes stop_codon:yes gene_type:complete